MEDYITQDSEIFIRDLFEKEIQKNLRYHDILHTEYVASQAEKIGISSGLSEEELQVVIIAAWFHDSGFVSRSDGHEEENFLAQKKYRKSL